MKDAIETGTASKDTTKTDLLRLILLIGVVIGSIVFGIWNWNRDHVDEDNTPEASPRVGAQAEDPLIQPPFQLQASSSDPKHPPSLMRDGRTDGVLPFGWRPDASQANSDVSVRLTWAWPQSLAGVRIVWPKTGEQGSVELVASDASGATLAKIQQSIDRTSSIAMFEQPVTASKIELRGVFKEGIVELQPIAVGKRVWLVSEPHQGDLDAEILMAYGARTVERASFQELTDALLHHASVVVLRDSPTPEAVASVLKSWMERGGVVVELGSQSGVCSSASAQTAATTHRVSGKALSAPARWLGKLSPPSESGDLLLTSEEAPVLVRYTRGQGRCFRWSGSIAHQIRLQRQGDPARADVDIDKKGGFQPRDLLMGSLNRADHATPSADLLGYALATLVAQQGPGLLANTLPAGVATVMVMTADQDFVPDAAVFAQSRAARDVGLTAMLTAGTVGAKPDVNYNDSPPNMVAPLTVRGLGGLNHEVGIHPNVWKLEEGTAGYNKVIATHANVFAEMYGVRPLLVRNHHLVWSGYVEMARIHARAGLRMNFDYISLAFAPDGDLGYMASGAVPLRFSDVDGNVVPLFQQPTQLDDHVMLPARFGYHHHDAKLLFARSRALSQAAVEYRTPLVVNHHPYWWLETEGRWQKELLKIASEQNIAVWGGGRWLRFVDATRQLHITQVGVSQWDVRTTSPKASVLVPLGDYVIHRDGQAIAWERLKMGGVEWSVVTLEQPGMHRIEVKRNGQ